MEPVIDRSSPLPLWAQITDDLRKRTGRGEFDVHFPTEEELAQSYGVSRQTVREAIRRLESDGLVVRQRGRGTSVRQAVLEQPLNAIYSLASTVRAGGLKEHSTVLSLKRVKAPAEAVRLLGPEAEDSIYIERIRFAGDDTIGWDRSWLPWGRAFQLLDADLTLGGIYEALDRYCGIRITGGWERIQPVVPTLTDQKNLKIGKEVGIFAINRLAMSGPDPIEWRRSRIRGDRYCLIAQWPKSSLDGAVSQDSLPSDNEV